MMNEKAREAIRLISCGEGQQVEFKQKTNFPEKIVREVVAFANSEGGHLFIGVSDDGRLAGLKYPEEDEFVLNKAIRDLCRPAIDFDVDLVRMREDVEILHYLIHEGKNKPYYALLEKQHRYGKAFVRVKDRSIQASNEIRKILKERGKDQRPLPIEETLSDLFRYLEQNTSITLSQYRQISGLNKRLASDKLVSLALSGALRVEPKEGEDVFFLSQ